MTAAKTTSDPGPGSGVIGAVIVARMKSSRLPGKSMLELAGKPSLEWMVRRLGASRYIQRFVFATTTDPADEPIAVLAARLGHQCFRGSEEDVLGRVYAAVEDAGLDIVVHVTGDCPLVDARLADACVDLFLSEQVDYTSIDLDAHPQGLEVEVFSAEVLGRVDSSFSDPWVREHVTLPLYTMPHRFRALKVPAPPELRRPEYRICIDTPQDYALVKEIVAHLLPVRENFSARDIVRLLDSRPDLVALNAEVKETKYPCGVIGLGAVGALYERQAFAENRVQTHTRAYLRYGKTHLVAGCDPDPARRADFVADWKIDRVYPTAAEMFANEDLAIVSIATPPTTHADLCLQAIDAGVRAIFCEKPFVLDSQQGRRVLQACKRNGVLLAVNHSRRWWVVYRAMRDFLQAGGLGEVQSVRFHYTKGAMNSGTHAVDLLRFLFGEIDSVLATEAIRTDTGDDDIGGILRMGAGFPVHLTVSDYRAHFCFELDVIGTRGRVRTTDDVVEYWRAAPSRLEAGLTTLQPASPPFDTDVGAPFEAAVAELVDHLDCGRGQTACSGEDGLRAVEVIRALQQSWTAGGESVECAAGTGPIEGTSSGVMIGPTRW